VRLALVLIAPLPLLAGAARADDALESVRQLRLEGALAEAQAAAERALGQGGLGPEPQVELHLELALVHDRRGLHLNTRPVPESLRHVEAAAALAVRSTPRARARVELARADYHYQAEMAGRVFEAATRHAQGALRQFRELEDDHGEADALHKLALIHLQRGELDMARALLDQSRERDREGGGRPTFEADYERHVGYVLLRRKEAAASIPHFERSLKLRREAGALDPSLSAAISLAQALVDAGRGPEAGAHLLYALVVAQRLGSAAGTSQAALLLARVYEAQGDPAAARVAGELALRTAEGIAQDSISRQAREVLGRVSGRSR
jgi:tetratricopeptide (TPR) repeat protein